MSRVLAIDPGLSGAYALLSSAGLLHEAGDLPTVGDGSQRRINGAAWAALIDRLRPDVAVIEQVSAMPKQGVSSSFRFGRAVGAIEGVLLGKGVTLCRVTAQTWKRQFGLIGKEKGSGEPSRQRAIERWPRSVEFFTRKKDHNRAEASLIGLWYVETAAPDQREAA